MSSAPESTGDGVTGDGRPPRTDPGAEHVGDSLLSLAGIAKSFGPVQALHRVDLDVPAGQVTALIGDNGAGKSVADQDDLGDLPAVVRPGAAGRGTRSTPTRRKDASDLGIATVYQDLSLCDNLDIVQNMYLGREETRAAILDEIKMELATKELLEGPGRLDGQVGPPAGRLALGRPAPGHRRRPRGHASTRSSSSWTSPPPRSASPRPPWCSSSCGRSPNAASP